MQIHVEEPEMINYTGKVGMFNVEIGVPLVHLALRQQSIFYYMMFCVIRKKIKKSNSSTVYVHVSQTNSGLLSSHASY